LAQVDAKALEALETLETLETELETILEERRALSMVLVAFKVGSRKFATPALL
jgi:hypothetical protein